MHLVTYLSRTPHTSFTAHNNKVVVHDGIAMAGQSGLACIVRAQISFIIFWLVFWLQRRHANHSQ